MRLKVSNVCQLLDKSTFWGTTRNGVTVTNNGDGTLTINGTATYDTFFLQPLFQFQTSNPGYHTYLLDIGQYSGNANAHGVVYFYDDNVDSSVALIGTQDSSAVMRKINGPIAGRGTIIQARFAIVVLKGVTVTNWTIRPQLFDLTEMYGAGNEPTTVEQFRQDFPNEMYEYSPECWKKFRRLKYVTETKNLLSDIIVPTNSSGVSYDEKSGIFTVLSNDKAAVGFSKAVMDFITPIPVGTVITVSIYCISGRYSATGDHTAVGGYHKYASPTDLASWQGVVVLPRNTDLSGKTFTTTWTVTKPLDAFWIYVPRQTDIIEEDIKFRAQLELGSTASPYQPYGYLPLNRGKYIANKEPVQLLDKSKYPATQTKQGVTYTNDGNGIITLNGTNTASYLCVFILNVMDGKPGHKYMQLGATDDGFWNRYGLELKWIDGDGVGHGFTMTNGIMSIPSDVIVRNIYVSALVYQGYTVSNKTFKPQLFDLTEMYGAGNEPTTVAQFKADYPNELYDYNPYNAITFR